MMNIKTLVISVSTALGLLLLSMPVGAEVNNHWLIKSGDTVYSIARKMHPGDVKKQVRFRRELVKANPDIFAGNSNLMSVGSKLRLPGYVTIKKPAQNTKPIKTRITQKAVTPDPQDIIGKVVINIGDLKATNRNATRRLSRHSEIISGDTLKTSKNARAQIRMKDGALISLQPDTEFKIAEYHFNGKEDGSERGIFELIKGGFRTITGLIGHKNKQNYRVRTTVATIGIRGTHYGLMLCEANSCAADNLANGLYGGVVDGSIAATNTTGETLFNNDEFMFVASSQDQPVRTLTPPPVFDGQLVNAATNQTNDDKNALTESQTTFVINPVIALDNSPELGPLNMTNNLATSTTSNSANNTTSSPTLPTDNFQAPAGSGMLLAFNHLPSSGVNTGRMTGEAAQVIVEGNNQILIKDVTLPSSQIASSIPFKVDEYDITNGNTHHLIVDTAATLNDYGNNPNLRVNWGRWTGNFSVYENGIAFQTRDNLHFVYSDNLTPEAYLGGLTSTSNLYHSSVPGSGGTLPTDTLGGIGTASTFSVTMDFLNRQMTQYTVTADTPNIAVNAGASNVSFAQLSNFTISDLGTSCVAGPACSGQASVAFVGAQAEGVISSYTLAASDGSVAASGSGLALSASGPPQ